MYAYDYFEEFTGLSIQNRYEEELNVEIHSRLPNVCLLRYNFLFYLHMREGMKERANKY